MAVPAALKALAGEWQGVSRLWLSPETPVRESESTADISLLACERFLEIRYTWAEEGKPQEGMIMLGMASEQDLADAVWIDSWHMGDVMMLCEGPVEKTGSFSVKGAYAVPPGPDWGWRITLIPDTEFAFRLVMHNISPEGEEVVAVEARYLRRRRRPQNPILRSRLPHP